MFKSIVVGTDGSDTAKVAVKHAAELAEAQGSELHLVMAAAPKGEQPVRSDQTSVPDDVAHTQSPNQDIEARLDAVIEGLPGGVNVIKHARQGDPADAIIDVAEQNRSDLIVVGNKGMTGAKRFFLGAVPNKISHHAPCSVLIVRTTP